MKLEDATSNNTCEYSLTGKFFRVKLLGRMKCNIQYAVFAVEVEPDTIYKAYTFGESANHKKVGDIFYVKFDNQRIMDDLTRIYGYVLCDENGNYSKKYGEIVLDYENYFTQEYTDAYKASLIDPDTSDDEN